MGIPVGTGSNPAVAVSFSDGAAFQYTNILAFDFTDGHLIAQYPAGVTDSSGKGIGVVVGTTKYPVPSSSPPMSNGASLYYLGYSGVTGQSMLAKLDLTGDGGGAGTGKWTQSGVVTFGGESGSSPQFVDDTKFSNFPYSQAGGQVVLHVPNLAAGTIGSLSGCSASATGGQLVSFTPTLSGCNWYQKLYYLNPGDTADGAAIAVSPVVDPITPGFWVWTNLILANGQTSLTGVTLYHYPAAGPTGSGPDQVIPLSTVCNPVGGSALCGSSPMLAGHMFGINPKAAPSNPSKLYLAVTINEGGSSSTPNAVVAVDTDTATKAAGGNPSPVLKWIAPFGDLSNAAFGAALPLVTVPGSGTGSRAGMIFSGATKSAPMTGDVSLIKSAQ
jgi:hypothetical protein